MSPETVCKIAVGALITFVILIFSIWFCAIWIPEHSEQLFWTGCLFIPGVVISTVIAGLASDEF